jgi:hypothetical protein
LYDTDDGRLFSTRTAKRPGLTLVAVLQGGPQLDDEDFLIV